MRSLHLFALLAAGSVLTASVDRPVAGPKDGEGRAAVLSSTPPDERGKASAVEIRSYNLTPGTRPEFHRLVVEESMPLLDRWNVDVVAYGPSLHDETSYFLIRAFESVEARRRSEDAFYGSDEWRDGPRDAILGLIESYATIVMELDDDAMEALRANGWPGTHGW